MAGLPSYSEENLAKYPSRGLLDLLIADEDRAPRNLIDECACREDMVPVLSELVERDYYWQDGITRGEWWLLVHAPMILGLIHTQRAGELLVALMRRMERAQDDELQDWLADRWPLFFRHKPPATEAPLRDLAEDRSADWYMRIQAVSCVLAMARERAADVLDAALDWTAGLAAEPHEDRDFRILCGGLLLDFPRARHRALVEKLIELQKLSNPYFDAEEIAEAFIAGDAPSWTADPWSFYLPEAITARQEAGDDDLDALDLQEPYVRLEPKVGRNDPCPCGSGKKYKKCCLLQSGAT